MEGVLQGELQATLWRHGGQAGAALVCTVDERQEETSILEGNTQQFKKLII